MTETSYCKFGIDTVAIKCNLKLRSAVCDKGTRRRKNGALDSRTKGNRRLYIESMDSRGNMMPRHRKLATVAFNVLCEPRGCLKLGGARADAGYRPWSMYRRCVVLCEGL